MDTNKKMKNWRYDRKQSLIGRYLVVVDNQNGEGILYLQNSKYGSGYWTKYMANAVGFVCIMSAIRRVEKLNYGNPRVVKLQEDGVLKEVF